MQSSEERSKGAARPSLLTPAQQAEADRNRILTKLEHGTAEAPVKRPRGKMLAWGTTGVLAVALAGAAAFWTGGERPVAPTAVAAVSALPPARVVTPPAPAAEAPPAPASAAAIHEEQPAAASPAPAVETSVKPGADDLRSALEEGTTEKKTVAPKAAQSSVKKPAKPARPETKAASRAAPKSAPKAAPKAAPAPDSDLALLSALVAHTQSTRSPGDGLHALRRELKACRQLKGSKARDCREEACIGQDRSVRECR